ncbi:Protein TsgA [Buchnera aphidicola (Tetraneura ulmi)]|uniref:MFS transporter TsgA n=1 Tax=Buchnera aphidicola TaxID=9 RepID=UPI003A7788E2
MKDNKIRLTSISFLSYLITGALVTVTGVMMENMAKYFHISISHISHIFTFLNFGILIAIFLNAWLIKTIPIKNQLQLGFILMIISIGGLIYSKNLIIFSINIFIMGIVSGITMSIGTLLITYLYKGKKRASLLLITDSFFSLSGTFFPIIASFLMSIKKPWYYVYIIIDILYLLIFVLSLITQFPTFSKKIKKKTKEKKKLNLKKKICLTLLSISSTTYILGQLSFISWIPEYIHKIIKLNLIESGKLVSNFWMAYMIGMWFFSFILESFDLQKILSILSGISTIMMFFFLNSKKIIILHFTIIILGFFSSAIYTIIISLASLQIKEISPKIISLILTCGTIGSLLTFIFTGYIINKKGVFASLLASNILYSIVFIISIILFFFTSHKKNS